MGTELKKRDSSAGACAASGLLELASLLPEMEGGVYRKAAERILVPLHQNYATWHLPAHEAIQKSDFLGQRAKGRDMGSYPGLSLFLAEIDCNFLLETF